jgi:23S rRNA pseudouridine2604 synthase
MSRPILKLSKTAARRGEPDPNAPLSTRAQRARPRPSAPALADPAGPAVPAGSGRVPVSASADVGEAPRLSKRLGELGLCSRREADAWIENGWVKVDGRVVDTLGVRVSRQARIEIDPAATRRQDEQVTILLNKPIGYVSGQAEDGYRPAAVLITPGNRWSGDDAPIRFRPEHLRGLAPAGRLDIDSTGLLVFTQDGRIAKQLIGSESRVEKEYLVRVSGALSDDGLRLLRHGLELDGVTLRPALVSWQNADQLRFVLREGRKRQIRRMCALVGLEVTGLKRVRSGDVMLGDLPPGRWRYLGRDERF